MTIALFVVEMILGVVLILTLVYYFIKMVVFFRDVPDLKTYIHNAIIEEMRSNNDE